MPELTWQFLPTCGLKNDLIMPPLAWQRTAHILCPAARTLWLPAGFVPPKTCHSPYRPENVVSLKIDAGVNKLRLLG